MTTTANNMRVEDTRLEVVAKTGGELRSTLLLVAGQLRVTVNDVIMACLLGLLHRHLQQSTVVIGLRSDRLYSKNGLYETANVALLSVDISDSATFTSIVLEVAGYQIGATVHTGHRLGLSALFKIVANNTEKSNFKLLTSDTLVLNMSEIGSDFCATLGFDRRAYHREQMEEFLRQFIQLAEQAVRFPNIDVHEHSLVTQQSRNTLPDPSSTIQRARPLLLTEAFREVVDHRPTNVAISDLDHNWTYAQLAEISAALAGHLVRNGVEPGDVVVVTGKRSFALIGSMLGIFLSGGVLLTLDPKLPSERRKLMVKQARAKCLLYVGACDELDDWAGVSIRVDAVSGIVANTDPFGSVVQLPTLQPEWPAYVFFTSGSTGIPKAVVGTHEGLGHFLGWQRETFKIGESDRAAHITALSFDVVLRDIFLALTAGATLCIPSELDILDPSAILPWMNLQRITVLHAVPALVRAWLNNVPTQFTASHLRLVFFAGEPLSDFLVKRFRQLFGSSVKIVNLYGPTETTLAKCYHVIGEPEPGIQPIGRPIPNTQVLILNPKLQLCGLYETGQIAIRTPYKTLGYLNNPDANALAFILNPWRGEKTDVIYLTGDRGHYRADGVLEISGRMDNQVKIRGMRVEPGEIESVLCQHPGIQDAVIIGFDRGKIGKGLAAYFVMRSDQSGLSKSECISVLREFLIARLPEHMVPEAFIQLDSIPLNPNGKVDRRGLPSPTLMEQSQSGQDLLDLMSPTERELSGIWGSLLGRSPSRAGDDFFSLGGDSLLAVSMLYKVKEAFGVDVGLGYVFTLRTVKALAVAIDAKIDIRRSNAGLVSLSNNASPGVGGAHLICICGIQLYEPLAKAIDAPHAVSGVFLPIEERFLSGLVAPRLRDLAAMYGEVVRQAQPRGPYRLAGLSFGGMLAFELACQLQRLGETVDFLGIFDTTLPSTISRWARLKGHAQLITKRGRRYAITRLGKRTRLFMTRKGSRKLLSSAPALSPEMSPATLAELRGLIYRSAEREYMKHISLFAGDVHYFRAAEKNEFEKDLVPPDYNWSRFVHGRCYVHEVPGGHISMLASPAVDKVARLVRVALEQCVRKA